MSCHSLLQGIFPTQGLNLGLLHCRQILYHLSHQGSPACVSRTLNYPASSLAATTRLEASSVLAVAGSLLPTCSLLFSSSAPHVGSPPPFFPSFLIIEDHLKSSFYHETLPLMP